METLKKLYTSIPGYLMLVPLLLGACVHTFAPGLGKYFGGFTDGLITGATPIIAVWFFCMGTTIDVRASGTVLRRSGTLLVVKLAIAWAVTSIAAAVLPPDGITTGILTGLSVLAVVTAFDYANAALFSALMTQYSTKEDVAAFVILSLDTGPFCSMLILGSAGVAHFSIPMFVGIILPFILGFILGHLSDDIRQFFAQGTTLLIPFLGFALGNGIDFRVILDTGIAGVLLGVCVIVISALPLIYADKYLGGGTGIAGLAAATTAGGAVANPMLIANMAPQFKSVAASATVMVSASLVITAILVPILVGLYHKYVLLPKKGLSA